jgi:hypothetical protein
LSLRVTHLLLDGQLKRGRQVGPGRQRRAGRQGGRIGGQGQLAGN